MKHYDFIITGGGAAGRSFLYHLLQSPLKNSSVLLIDKDKKNKDDRTWCFWEDEEGPFEEIVHKSWSQLWFHSSEYSKLMDITPFSYKMILASDYYQYTDKLFATFPNVDCIQEKIECITNKKDRVEVQTGKASYTSTWCLNSIFQSTIDKEKVNYVDQHFRGWFIKTEEPFFDTENAVLMDFRVNQCDEFRFFYLLPISPTQALVEVAIFSNNHLREEEYDTIIKNHLALYWKDLPEFVVERIEQGAIPMTDYTFPEDDGRIIHIGTAGGDTRASTGYTFIYIHRRIQKIIEALTTEGVPYIKRTRYSKRFRLYDSLLLTVLTENYHSGEELFSQLFKRNDSKTLLRFLSGDTSLLEELRLMRKTPIDAFVRALMKKIAVFLKKAFDV